MRIYGISILLFNYGPVWHEKSRIATVLMPKFGLQKPPQTYGRRYNGSIHIYMQSAGSSSSVLLSLSGDRNLPQTLVVLIIMGNVH